MSTESKLAIVCLSENGKNLALQINEKYESSQIYIINNNNKISIDDNCKNTIVIQGEFSEIVKYIFKKYENILFIMATGIVVRTIAPLIQSKLSDPAVLVCDEKGTNVISLLSGHMGGANELTLKISKLINSNPVITTATDVNNKSALDNISKKLNAHIDNFRDRVKDINSMLVNNEKVGIYIDGDYEVDTRGFEKLSNLDNINHLGKIVVISNRVNPSIHKTVNISEDNKFIKVTPKNIVLGIGCRRNTNSLKLKNTVKDFLETHNIDIKSVYKIGSIDIKFDEQAIIDLSKELSVPFETIDKEDILKIEDLFDKSEFVKKQVGVYNVSEPVAYILSNKNVIVKKTRYDGITISMGRL